jgi:hypothetical protein
VAGRGFDLDLVEAVTGLEDEAALDAAEAAVLAGLVIEDDRAAGRYRFAHALVRETIYADISRARRARLHARVAGALLATRGAEPEPAAEMAYHCWQAAPVIGAGRASPGRLSAPPGGSATRSAWSSPCSATPGPPPLPKRSPGSWTPRQSPRRSAGGPTPSVGKDLVRIEGSGVHITSAPPKFSGSAA